MLSPLARLVVVLLLGAVYLSSARAQVTPANESGVPAYGSFHGSDFDQINLLNGNLHIDIPTVTIKERGRTFAWHFYYEPITWNMTWHVVPRATRTAPDLSYYSVTRYGSQTGLFFANDFSWAAGSQAASPLLTCGSTTPPQQYQVYTGFYVLDPNGTVHPLPLRKEVGASCNGSSLSGPTMDGSGIYFNLTTNIITLPNGTQINQASSQLEDSNGNFSPFGSDMLGRTPVTSTQGPNFTFTSPLGAKLTRPQYTILTITDTNGQQQPYRFDYQLVDLRSNMCSMALTRTCNEDIGDFDLFVKQLTLPDGRAYIFTYNNNSPGELARVDLPTGAYITYTYSRSYFPVPGTQQGTNPPNFSGRQGVSTRTVNFGGTSSQWSYSAGTVTNPDGTSEVHSYNYLSDGTHSSATEYEQSVTYKNSSGNTLRTVSRIYASDLDPFSLLLVDGRVIRTTTTLDNGLVSKTETDYETFQYNCVDSTFCPATGTRMNPTETREFDYASGVPGSLVRRTDYTYLHQNNSAYAAPNINIVNKPASVLVYDGSGNLKAKTLYEYDNYTSDSHHQSLQPSGAVNHDPAFGASYTLRGNLTAVSRWRNTDGALLTTYNQYDDSGNIIATIDPNGNKTTFDYTDSWASGFPGSSGGTACAPANSGQGKADITKSTNALGQITLHTYYSCSGLVGSTADPNAQTTTQTYDLFQRPLVTTFPDTGTLANSYDDTNLITTTNRSVQASPATFKTSNAHYDQLGRVTQTQLTSDPDGTDFTDTTYDALGRVSTVSNPHRATALTTDGITTTIYDALNRVCVVVPPDGTAVSGNTCPATQPANDIFTTYSGNCTTVTDQAGKSRKSCSDGLGRLTQVFEDPAGQNLETDYQYDALSNLLTVNQKGGSPTSANWRTRTFTYNSLSQLTSATNPESGTISYTYDANGNLLTKTSPAPNQTGSATVTLSYCYDALNRLTSKAYTSQSCPMASPVATYSYDQASFNGLTIANGIGRRTGMTDAAGSEAWSYDSMGRVAADQRTTNGVTQTFPYTYNLDGSLATFTYPGAHPLPMTFQQGAAGRPLSEISSPVSFAYNAHYAPNGSLCSMNSGWGQTFTHIWTFNNRLQPARIQLYGTGSGTPASLCAASTDTTNRFMDFTYSYPDANGHNNGNVASITNNLDFLRTQSFAYDSLNRLSTAQTFATNQPAFPGDTRSINDCWGEQFNYDPWGNLFKISPVSTAYTGCTQEGLDLTGQIATNNRIAATGFTYDAAGNLIAELPAAPFTYNAENQLTSAGGVAYTYDGDGKRVMKSNGKLYWYGTGSSPMSETDLAGNVVYRHFYFNGLHIARSEPNWVDHYGLDALGNTRFVYGLNGATDVSDFYPFGTERPVLSGTNNPYKFTGKERDSESGLDNFGARYLGSSMGRFMSPDPDQDAGFNHMDDPQSWNGYAYTRNNPLLYTDPAGTNYLVCDNDGKNCADLTDKQYDQFRQDNPNLRVTPSGDIYTINQNGTETKTGSESYYNEKDTDAAAHIAASQLLINEFMKQMAYNAVGGYFGGRLVGLGLDALEAANAARAAAEGAQAANAGRSAAVELTGHAAVRLAQRGITQAVVDEAVQTAEATGQVTSKVGQYGTVQNIYKGTNGITVIVETEGRNAGKVITAFQTGSKP